MLNKLIIPVLLLISLLTDMKSMHYQSNNYWTLGAGSSTGYPLFATNFVNNNAVIYLPEDPSFSFFNKPSDGCGAGFFPAITNTLDTDSLSSTECEKLEERCNGYVLVGKSRWAYDSLRYYIEQCYTHYAAPYAFSAISSACFDVSYKELYWEFPNYKQWLLSVLYLNPDTIYYCRDAFELARVQVWLDSGRGDFREGISILKYLLDSVDCKYLNHDIEAFVKELHRSQMDYWRDSVVDSTLTPPDTTTIYSLDELGLQDLRKVHSSVSESDIIAAGLIVNIHSIPNPARDETELQFTLTDPALLRLEVFDALGRSIYEKSLGWMVRGKHLMSIEVQTWSPGTYYARLTTLRGEVQTVKLVKE